VAANRLNHRGQTMVEYLLLVSLVALIALKVGSFVRDIFQEAGPQLKEKVIEEELETGIGFR